ncbi:putative transmembrane protein [Apostichopus japonicus]|uniref:Putative transmembrane protein n=1 Tax=Stichopus japonicus TaxID=307972 RepID=A0A2G8LBW7_STIJA|nr:putative transmembrane protein [Apostichopus japonicus]
MSVFSIDRNAFFLSLTLFGSGLMSCVFHFYYVKLFLDKYNISQPWFQFAQVVYLIWNAINDPLFAYWQDNSKMVAFRSRRHAILYGAPLYALCFLLFWFPWRDYTNHDWLTGVHLMVALCCYDSLLTFVLLAYCSLFAEISKDLDYRLTLMRYGKAAGILASTSVTALQFISNGLEDFHAFQMCCICIAFMAWISMHFTGKHVRTNPTYSYDALISNDEVGSSQKSVENEGSFQQPLRQLRQILTKDFVAFVATNFLQIFHKEYGANFMVIFGDQLIPKDDISDFTRKLFYGSSAILPTLAVFAVSPVIAIHGYYKIIVWTNYLNILLAIGMYCIGSSHTWILVAYMLIDRTPLSSSVFGYNALFTKPAISVAPMVVVAILNGYGYESLQTDSLTSQEYSSLRNAMFNISCFFPLVLSVCRLYTWSKYSIRKSHSPVARHIES